MRSYTFANPVYKSLNPLNRSLNDHKISRTTERIAKELGTPLPLRFETFPKKRFEKFNRVRDPDQ